jgi:hypothetical protein
MRALRIQERTGVSDREPFMPRMTGTLAGDPLASIE